MLLSLGHIAIRLHYTRRKDQDHRLIIPILSTYCLEQQKVLCDYETCKWQFINFWLTQPNELRKKRQ